MNILNINKLNIDNEQIIEKVCEYLEMKRPILKSSTTVEIIKELCVAKLCKVIGLSGSYNYKSEFFTFFSEMLGEVVCEKLSLKIHIARDEIRLIKYEGINLIEETRKYLKSDLKEEAVLNVFELADKYKHLLKII